MRLFRIQFVVQAHTVGGAIAQGERYLNVGDRVVDFDVIGIPDGHGTHPTPAPVLDTDERP